MTWPRRLVILLCAFVVATSVPASASADTAAVAVNTKDGASIFRLAFQVRRVADSVVDESNAAAAIASCSECETVALAFQAVLVFGDTTTVTPENLALAYNEDCIECLTYAAATQLVLGFDGPVRLTADGERRLQALRSYLLQLRREDDWSVEQLEAVVDEARAELRDIFATEVVPAGQPEDTSSSSSPSTTTTSTPSPTSTSKPATTTTSGSPSTTTTTSAERSTTTTTTTTTTTSTP